ncbi:septum formation inhibitor Maf [uncultured Polaribacter sp.]|uniref:septum formation inhibitor Maf n=1 Tax=uncultured Polaribacter sp. TaxID=174711 RepID=UPI0030D98AA9|tara:strand:- start:397 stop:1320 length:924 start_codon:yes stop_codon:yes gene_type:complete
MNKLLKIFYLLSIFFLFACKQEKNVPTKQINTAKKEVVVTSKKSFNAYWYSGKAELNSYALKQSRYGEIREGEVVLVFVTEPFSLNKQVKLDNAKEAGTDFVSIMKLNTIRKFTTGIYEYSLMSSVFTPIDIQKYPHTLKMNTSVQEWCGHTFTQLNLKDNKYQFQEFSYFEVEGDTEKTIPVALLEDELMTRIRLQEGILPLGEIDLICSSTYSRLSHQELKVTKATIRKTATDSIITYTIDYLNFNRTVSMDIQKEFPYKILSWSEDNGEGLITEATLKKSIKEPYWNLKRNADETKRKELQLIN